jgi:hypothetical protein
MRRTLPLPLGGVTCGAKSMCVLPKNTEKLNIEKSLPFSVVWKLIF